MGTRACVSCGSVIDERVKFCPECGAQSPVLLDTGPTAITPALVSCAQCGEPLEPSDKRCPNCGELRKPENASTQEGSRIVTAKIRSRPTAPVAVSALTTPGTVASAPSVPHTPGSPESTKGLPLLALLAGGTVTIALLGAFAFPAISAQSDFGSYNVSLKTVVDAIGEENGVEQWPFVLSGIGVAIAIVGLIGAIQYEWWHRGALIFGPALALAVPGYLWHEIDKDASQSDSLVELGSGMMIFACLMLLTIALALLGDRLERRASGG